MSAKQKTFIEAYFRHNFNAAKACEVAGYKSLRVGLKNLQNPEVKAEIERRMKAAIMTKTEAEELLAKYKANPPPKVLKFKRTTRKQ